MITLDNFVFSLSLLFCDCNLGRIERKKNMNVCITSRVDVLPRLRQVAELPWRVSDRWRPATAVPLASPPSAESFVTLSFLPFLRFLFTAFRLPLSFLVFFALSFSCFLPRHFLLFLVSSLLFAFLFFFFFSLHLVFLLLFFTLSFPPFLRFLFTPLFFILFSLHFVFLLFSALVFISC